MIICIIARCSGTFGIIGLLRLCGYEKNDLNKITCSELTFVAFAGLIRGAIAFGLVLRLDPYLPNRGVIVTTCLSLVVFTTIFFGSIIGLLSKCLFGKAPTTTDEENDEALSNSNYSQSSRMDIILEQKKLQLKEKMTTLHYNASTLLRE